MLTWQVCLFRVRMRTTCRFCCSLLLPWPILFHRRWSTHWTSSIMTVSDIASILILLCVNYINSFSYKIWSVSIPFKCLKFASYLKKKLWRGLFSDIFFFSVISLGEKRWRFLYKRPRPPKFFIKKELEIEKSGEKTKTAYISLFLLPFIRQIYF